VIYHGYCSTENPHLVGRVVLRDVKVCCIHLNFEDDYGFCVL
jgi:hypothetical protein